MVRLTPIHAGDHLGSVPLAIGLFVSVSALVALCAKHASRVRRRNYETKTSNSTVAPKSPLMSPKHLLTTISNKAIPFFHNKKGSDESEAEIEAKAEEGVGEEGLWQRTILMGEKCQPIEFSGVIYYDSCGNQISELPPRSPRVTAPLPSFSFPVAKDEN